MRKIYNSRVLVTIVAVLSIAFQSKGQLSHFIYLQTESKQPFYIKYNSKIISSTSSGYIILSKLNNGEVNFSLGFPQSNETEQKFSITIDKTEKGFLVKNFNDKGWGLFDLQSAAITYAVANQTPVTTNTSTVITQAANDPFANMLSNVTQDSTVKNVTVKKEEKPVVADTPKLAPPSVVKTETPKKEEPVIQKQDTKPVEPKKEEVVIQKPIVIDTPKTQPQTVLQQPIVQEPVFTAPQKSTVQRIRRFDSREGTDLVYEVLETNGIRDTVRLFIAADSSAISQSVVETKQENLEEKKDTVQVTPLPQSPLKIIPEIKKEEPKPQETKPTPEVKKEEIKPEIKSEVSTKPATIPNSNCREEANEEDFLKLRKRMASQTKEESMVNEAKKVFKTKCFSTAQIRNLAVLFLTDEWRYRFYDTALPYVTDFNAFKYLSDTISDDYYKKRFQALLPNQ